MIRIVHATQELMARAFPEGQVRWSGHMFVALREDDDKILGFAGIFPHDNRLVVISSLTDELRRCKRAIVTGYRRILEIADRSRLPLQALADEKVEASERFLEHLGFRHIGCGCWERPARGGA